MIARAVAKVFEFLKLEQFPSYSQYASLPVNPADGNGCLFRNVDLP